MGGGGGTLAKESFCDHSRKQTIIKPKTCQALKFTGHWFRACSALQVISYIDYNAEQEHAQNAE